MPGRTAFESESEWRLLYNGSIAAASGVSLATRSADGQEDSAENKGGKAGGVGGGGGGLGPTVAPSAKSLASRKLQAAWVVRQLSGGCVGWVGGGPCWAELGWVGLTLPNVAAVGAITSMRACRRQSRTNRNTLHQWLHMCTCACACAPAPTPAPVPALTHTGALAGAFFRGKEGRRDVDDSSDDDSGDEGDEVAEGGKDAGGEGGGGGGGGEERLTAEDIAEADPHWQVRDGGGPACRCSGCCDFRWGGLYA